MRIAMVGSRGLTNSYSGIETSLQVLCPRLVQRGHHVTVFGDEGNVGSYEGVALQAVPALLGKHSETLTRSFVATWRTLTQGFDVLHFHDVAPALWSPAARLARQPTLLTLHSLDWKRSKWSALSQAGIRLVEQVALRNVRRIAVVSQSLQSYVQQKYKRESPVLAHVVEPAAPIEPGALSAQLGLEPRKYLLFAARLVREKAPHELIRAFRTLSTDFTLVIAGGGRYEEEYERELRELARGSAVRFTGQLSRTELQELYSNAYLFVLPSHVEGRSMSLLEAMAHGTAVLVSDIAENVELVPGALCTYPTGDESALAARLAQLIHEPAQMASLRACLAQNRAGSGSWDDVIDGYERLYRELVTNGHRGC